MAIREKEQKGRKGQAGLVVGGALREAVLRARRADSATDAVLLEMAKADEAGEDVPAYLLEFLQTHRNRQHLEDDFILGYHDDYRERYDGFDQPPPFRQKAKPKAAGKARAVSDLEISEEEAFSTRVFVTTPRRQR
ncbi:uncharacterized protein LOC117648388 [Thrips palmi]|uniref:Uncharacterized protein LOC117648388 n=1 Tax=Thrips palmi TaxID=161013 RepID=A0A6P8ZCU8_THRPL|nr:uncharacterized protein LOC117648388 [Thrips palmi]